MRPNLLVKNRSVLLYGISLALLLFLLKWLELRFLLMDYTIEIYISAIALIFTALGIWLALKLTSPKIETIVVEKTIAVNSGIFFVLDETMQSKFGISKRELEVLELMAKGLSNHEIAKQLFVSVNTVKTHSSRLFEKLDVRRRTQAIEKAKRLCLIP